MNKVLQEKIKEAFSSVLPITAIVLIASIILVPMSAGVIVMFLVGAALLIIGMGFFTLGADMAMMPMGEGIGAQLTKGQSVLLAVGVSFIMGLVITIAEPDLQVLALQLAESLNPWVLIITVGIGVGLFLAIAVLRVLFGIPLRFLLLFLYTVTFGLGFYMLSAGDGAFIPVSFDSGGVTTGPITVPFMLAMCLGVASLRGDKSSKDDSFGFVALCSVGPILSVMVLGVINHITKVTPQIPSEEAIALIDKYTDRDVVVQFIEHFPETIKEVAMALGAILVFFVIFQLITRRYKRHQLARIMIGFLYTFIGLVVFLTGVNVGFIPVGSLFGSKLGESELKWILVPLSMLIGYFIVAAEPAVHVLNKQVEEVSQGAITQKTMNTGLAVGMALALGITMVRILLGIPIMYILVPGYAFALILTFFVPKIFTGIAFDSGGVCSGPMTSTFLLPFAIGACAGSGGDTMRDAFGIVAMVAMTPLVVIQLLGLVYGIKMAAKVKGAGQVTAGAGDIIVFEEGYTYG
jgi:MFS family permease